MFIRLARFRSASDRGTLRNKQSKSGWIICSESKKVVGLYSRGATAED